MNDRQCQDDEIDLRDYIKVMIKRKKIILSVFFVSVITTAVVGLLSPKVYQASVSIMIIPSKIQSALSPGISLDLDIEKNLSTGEYITQRPVISMATHETLLKSNIVLERVIEGLKLIDKQGKILIAEDLFKKLDIKETKETNLLQLRTKDTNPKKAKELANIWAQEYVKYSQELILGEIKGTGEFITDQFEIAQQNLVQAEEKVKNFKDEYKLDLKRAELDIKKTKLNDYKKELIDLAIILKTKEDSVKELKKELAKQEKFIIVSKAITDDALWQQVLKEKDVSVLNKKKLSSEVINPIYQDIEKRSVDTEIEINTLKPRIEYLSESISLTELEINELEKTVNQKEFELIQLNRQVEIYKRTYDNLSAKIEEARITKAAQLGEVKIISPAIEPKYSIERNKRFNIAISGILGLFVGVLIGFFQEFLKKSK